MEKDAVRFRPIGIVHTKTTDEEVRKHITRGKESVVEIYPEFQADQYKLPEWHTKLEERAGQV